MISDLAIFAVEVGYVAGVAALTKALLSVVKRVERWRTASRIHETLKAMEEVAPAPSEPRGYRSNAVPEVNVAPAASSSWLSRRRAERAARYVQKLEDEATMKRMKSFVVLAALAFVTLASSARADETSHTIVLKTYVVYGHAARPMAVTEVTKLPMQTTVSDLRQPFVQRVEQAVQSKPF